MNDRELQTASQVNDFNRFVIAEVLKLARADFLNEGVDESVLVELQGLWEGKLSTVGDEAPLEVDDTFYNDLGNFQQNFQYQGTAANLTSLSQQIQPAGLPLPAELEAYARPKPYLAIPPKGKPGSTQQPATRGFQLNGQLDGTADEIPPPSVLQSLPQEQRSQQIGGQYDGQSDGSDNDDVGKVDDGDESLHSDLDDPNEDEEDAETDNLILCMYEKVTRIRNKWKFILRDGIMHVDGRDYLFRRATGELEW